VLAFSVYLLGVYNASKIASGVLVYFVYLACRYAALPSSLIAAVFSPSSPDMLQKENQPLYLGIIAMTKGRWERCRRVRASWALPSFPNYPIIYLSISKAAFGGCLLLCHYSRAATAASPTAVAGRCLPAERYAFCSRCFWRVSPYFTGVARGIMLVCATAAVSAVRLPFIRAGTVTGCSRFAQALAPAPPGAGVPRGSRRFFCRRQRRICGGAANAATGAGTGLAGGGDARGRRRGGFLQQGGGTCMTYLLPYFDLALGRHRGTGCFPFLLYLPHTSLRRAAPSSAACLAALFPVCLSTAPISAMP